MHSHPLVSLYLASRSQPLGHSNVTRSVAHADAEKLLLLGEDKADGVLCAVDADPPHALRWTSAPGEIKTVLRPHDPPSSGTVGRVRIMPHVYQ